MNYIYQEGLYTNSFNSYSDFLQKSNHRLYNHVNVLVSFAAWPCLNYKRMYMVWELFSVINLTINHFFLAIEWWCLTEKNMFELCDRCSSAFAISSGSFKGRGHLTRTNTLKFWLVEFKNRKAKPGKEIRLFSFFLSKKCFLDFFFPEKKIL